jgi:hypothetical protein
MKEFGLQLQICFQSWHPASLLQTNTVRHWITTNKIDTNKGRIDLFYPYNSSALFSVVMTPGIHPLLSHNHHSYKCYPYLTPYHEILFFIPPKLLVPIIRCISHTLISYIQTRFALDALLAAGEVGGKTGLRTSPSKPLQILSHLQRQGQPHHQKLHTFPRAPYCSFLEQIFVSKLQQ